MPTSSASPAALDGPCEVALEPGELYARHAATVGRWARRLGGPGIDAEDVVQEVFVLVHLKLRQFRGEAGVETWLFRITLNEVNRQRRRRRPGLLARLGLGKEAEQVAAPEALPGEELERRQDVERLYRALDQLPEKQRTALILFELEELAGKQIAELMGIEPANLWVVLHRGRARLAKEARGGWEMTTTATLPGALERSAGEAGRLWKQARSLNGPSPSALAAIRVRVEQRVEDARLGPWARLRWSRRSLVLAVFGGTVVLASTGAGIHLARRPAASQPVAPAAMVVPANPVVLAQPAPKESEKTIEADQGVLFPVLEIESAPRPKKVAAVRPSPAVEALPPAPKAAPASPAEEAEPEPPPNADTTLGQETALLAKAMAAQSRKDSASALALLNEYRDRFGERGALQREAARARLEVLVSVGRADEALAVLEALANGSADTVELRVLKAELLAKSGRCNEAVAAADEVLEEARLLARERALFTRASCRCSLGDRDGCVAELEGYLAEFPAGRFSSKARAALGK
ncbi:MAG: sigma-70 family RNA polymerase sigma factor [Myxococcales bacterium]